MLEQSSVPPKNFSLEAVQTHAGRYQYSLATYFVLIAIMATLFGFVGLALQGVHFEADASNVIGNLLGFSLFCSLIGFVMGAFHRPIKMGLLLGALAGFFVGLFGMSVMLIPLSSMNHALLLSATGAGAVIVAALVGRWNR